MQRKEEWENPGHKLGERRPVSLELLLRPCPWDSGASHCTFMGTQIPPQLRRLEPSRKEWKRDANMEFRQLPAPLFSGDGTMET